MLAELRDLLWERPSYDTFNQIWCYLKQCQDIMATDELEAMASYASQHMSHWKPELRIHWIDLENPTPLWLLLAHLSCGWRDMGNVGVKALVGSPYLKNLQYLDLRFNKITQAGALAIANSPHLTSLQVLRMEGNRIGVKGVRAIATSPYLAQVKQLELL